MNSLILLVMISLATAAISFTITTTSIFTWLREWVSPWHHKVEELIHCPWCLSHYISLVILACVYDKTLFLDIPTWIHLAINWFALICLVGIYHFVLLRAYHPVAENMVRRQLTKMKSNKDIAQMHNN